jgi:ribosomal protein L3
MVKTKATDGYDAVQVRLRLASLAAATRAASSHAPQLPRTHPSAPALTPCPAPAAASLLQQQPQVGYKVVPERKVKKPELGHLKKAGCPPMKHLREFKVQPAAGGAGASSRGRLSLLNRAAWAARCSGRRPGGGGGRGGDQEVGGRAAAGAAPLPRLTPPNATLTTHPQLKDAEKVASYTPGQKLEVGEMFKEGDAIDIAGTTIGKGFQGEWLGVQGCVWLGAKAGVGAARVGL